MTDRIIQIWDTFKRRQFLRVGVPFIIFVAGGSFFLKHFTTIRYEFRRGKKLTKEEAESFGLASESVDINTVREEMMREIQENDQDEWENIRGPRPWEDSKTFQQSERGRLTQIKKEDSSKV